MITIRPFKAMRPTRDKASLVGSRPFYTYKKGLLKAKLESNPYTFLHVINPEFNKKDKTQPNTRERFESVRNKYDEFIDSGYFIKDDQPHYYLYRQTTELHTYTGLIAAISVEDYLTGKIKIHEHTLSEREEVFTKYLDVCHFNAEPVLLMHEKNEALAKLYNKYFNQRSEYEFSTTDRVKHDLWLISPEDNEIIAKAFSGIDKVYIADGHHRSASSVKYAEDLKEKNISNTEADFFLSFLIAEDELNIYEFNRLVTHLNRLSNEEFIEKISVHFNVSVLKKRTNPQRLHEFTMFLDGKWYLLQLKEEFISYPTPADEIDAEILSKLILGPILGITNLKTDTSILFAEGTLGTKHLQNMVNRQKAKVAFALYPVSPKQLKKIADANNIMPPKSTWIEPKLRSGLTIYEF